MPSPNGMSGPAQLFREGREGAARRPWFFVVALAPRRNISFNRRVSPSPRLILFCIVAIAAPLARAHEAATEMVAAANTFLDALNVEQKKQATYTLTDAERENWNFVPIVRQGLPFKKVTTEQQ